MPEYENLSCKFVKKIKVHKRVYRCNEQMVKFGFMFYQPHLTNLMGIMEKAKFQRIVWYFLKRQGTGTYVFTPL